MARSALVRNYRRYHRAWRKRVLFVILRKRACSRPITTRKTMNGTPLLRKRWRPPQGCRMRRCWITTWRQPTGGRICRTTTLNTRSHGSRLPEFLSSYSRCFIVDAQNRRRLMSTPLARPITEDEIRTYEETGVVHLKGLFDQAWIDHLREAMEYALIHPGKLAHNLSHDDPKGKFISETFLFHQHPGFREFVFQSPAAEIAAQVMRSTKANIVFDQHLVKEPETEQPTVWHHDLTYWPIRGNQVCTLWLALDPVREE